MSDSNKKDAGRVQPTKRRIPQASENAREYLKNYKHTYDVKTLEEMLDLEKFPELPNQIYEFANLCDQMDTISRSVINGGVSLPAMTTKVFISKLLNLRERLWEISVTQYDVIKAYSLPASASRSNTISLIFIINSNLLVLLHYVISNSPKAELGGHSIDLVKPNYREDELSKYDILIYDKPVLEFTQIELQNSIHRLAIQWNTTHYSVDIESYVSMLELRSAQIIIGRASGDVMDGKIHKDRVENVQNNKKNDGDIKFSCSSEYVSDIATIITRIRQSLYYRNKFKNDMIEADPMREWDGFNVFAMKNKLLDWLDVVVKNMEGGKFKDDARLMIMTLAGKRFGDQERFSRDNGGLESDDYSLIIDHCRTPMQSSWWTSILLIGGLPQLLKSKHKYIRSLSVANVFHKYCDAFVKFDWWKFCFFSENNLRTKINRLKLIDAPLVIQQMGEFNVWYNKKMYRTKEIEYAILMWCIIIYKHENCQYRRVADTPKDLIVVKTILTNLAGRSAESMRKEHENVNIEYNPKLQSADEDDASIFSEVYDSIVL